MAWTLRRTNAQKPIIAALAYVTAVTAFLLAALAGYNYRAEITGIRDYLAAMDGRSGALQIQTALGDDPAAQLQAGQSLFGGVFGDLPLGVHRSVTTAPIPVEGGSGDADADSDLGADEGVGVAAPTVRLADFDGVTERAVLVQGAWPGAAQGEPWHAALQQDAAHTLGLAVGDRITIGDSAPLTVVIDGIWAPRAPHDPFFTADAAGARSADQLAADRASAGFLLVDTDAILASGLKPTVNWTVLPRSRGVLPGDLRAMAAAVTALPSAVVADRAVAPSGMVVDGALSRTLEIVASSVVAASAVGVVPTLTIAAISLVMLTQLARLLVLSRRAETALIRSRGAGAGQLVRIAAAEAALVIVPSFAVALGGAYAVSRYLDVGLRTVGWVSAALVCAAAMAIMVGAAARQARLPANRQLIDDSGRAPRAAATGAMVLICVIAAVAWWRLSRSGSALVTDPSGEARLDPVAVLAPPAVLVAAALVCWAVFAASAGLAEWMTRRGTRLEAWLVSRDIARRAGVFGIVVVLIAIAFGSLGIAAVYAPTQRSAQEQANILANGAPVTVHLPAVDSVKAGPYQPSLDSRLAGIVGAGRAVPATQRPVTVGESDATLTGVPLDGPATAVLPVIPGSFDPRELAAALGPAAPGLPLPDGTAGVAVDMTVSLAWHRPGPVTVHSDGPPTEEPGPPGPAGQRAAVTLTAWVRGPGGAITPVAASAEIAVPLSPAAPGQPVDAAAAIPLPDLAAGSALMAIDVTLPQLAYPVDIDATIASLTATSAAGLAATWDIAAAGWTVALQPRVVNAGAPQLSDYELTLAGAEVTGSLPSSQVNTVRLGSAGGGPLPIAINPALADELDLTLGGGADVAVSATRLIPVRVAAISPLLPGPADQPALLADLAALDDALLRTSSAVPGANEIWTAPADRAAAETAIRPLLPPTATIAAVDTLSVGALADPAGVTLWVGAIGALLLATVGIGSAVAGLAGSRRGEPIVLRASGVGIRRLTRLRRAELWVTLAAAWLLGAAAAAAGVLLTVRTLAGSAVVGAPGGAAALRLDGGGLAVAAGAHLLAVAAIVIGYGLRVRRWARESTPSELVM